MKEYRVNTILWHLEDFRNTNIDEKFIQQILTEAHNDTKKVIE